MKGTERSKPYEHVEGCLFTIDGRRGVAASADFEPLLIEVWFNEILIVTAAQYTVCHISCLSRNNMS